MSRMRERQQGAHDGTDDAVDVETTDKRRAMRFSIMQRVDYVVGDKSAFGYSSNLSASGMSLVGVRDLQAGAELEFRIHFKGRSDPLPIRGVVRHVSASGSGLTVGIEFLGQQEQAVQEIRRLVESEAVSKLEASLKRSCANPAAIIQLATYYFEVGRRNDALGLCRRALAANGDNLTLFEALVSLVVQQLDAVGPSEVTELLDELDRFIQQGLSLGESRALSGAKSRTRKFRARIEQTKRQEEMVADERRRRETERELEKARQEIREAAEQEARAQLKAARREIEQQWRGKLEDAQRIIDGQRADLQAKEGTLTEQAAELTRLHDALKDLAQRNDARETALKAKNDELVRLQGEIEQERARRVALEGEQRQMAAEQAADLTRARDELKAKNEEFDRLQVEIEQEHSRRLALEAEQRQTTADLEDARREVARLSDPTTFESAKAELTKWAEENRQVENELTAERSRLAEQSVQLQEEKRALFEQRLELATQREKLGAVVSPPPPAPLEFDQAETRVVAVPRAESAPTAWLKRLSWPRRR